MRDANKKSEKLNENGENKRKNKKVFTFFDDM